METRVPVDENVALNKFSLSIFWAGKFNKNLILAKSKSKSKNIVKNVKKKGTITDRRFRSSSCAAAA